MTSSISVHIEKLWVQGCECFFTERTFMLLGCNSNDVKGGVPVLIDVILMGGLVLYEPSNRPLTKVIAC